MAPEVEPRQFEATETRSMAYRYRRFAQLYRMTRRCEQAEQADRAAVQFEAQALELEREWRDA